MCVGYLLSCSAFVSLVETLLYVSSSEQALRSLVSSPLARLAKVFFGWAELYSRYWNLFVGLKYGLMSSIRESSYRLPLYRVRSRKSTVVFELTCVNLMVGCSWLMYFRKSSSSDGGPGQMHRMSSMYLSQSRGFLGYSASNFSSSSAIKMFAYDGAIFVPMAVP